jgi:hypothetical protein
MLSVSQSISRSVGRSVGRSISRKSVSKKNRKEYILVGRDKEGEKPKARYIQENAKALSSGPFYLTTVELG